jgi:hypothetical protein
VRTKEHSHGEPRRAITVDGGEDDEKQQLEDLLASDKESLPLAPAAKVESVYGRKC